MRWRTIVYGASAAVCAAGLLIAIFFVRSSLYSGEYYAGRSLHEENLIKGTSVNQTNCMLTGENSFSAAHFDTCHLKSSVGMPTIYFVGSSHAMHLAGLGEVLHKKGFGIAFLTKQGHNFVPEVGAYLNNFGFSTSHDQAVFSILETHAEPGSIVVIGNRYAQDEYDRKFGESYFTGVSALANWFARKGVTVVHILPLPEFAFHDINQCAPQWFNSGMRDSGICLPKEPLTRARQSKDVEARFPLSKNLIHYDASKVLCPSGLAECFPVNLLSNLPTFRNGDHLSNHGASLLADDFLRFIAPYGLVPE